MSELNQENRIRVEKILNTVLFLNLKPYVINKLKERFGVDWERKAMVGNLDVQELLKTIRDDQKGIFNDIKYRERKIEKNIVDELLFWRNEFAHNKSLSSLDVIRIVDTIMRLLDIIKSYEYIDILNDVKKEVAIDLSGIDVSENDEISIEISHPDLGEPRDFLSWREKLSKAFYGREWLFADIENWVVDGKENLLLLTGEPGVGKSAIMSQLISKYNNRLLAYHICDANEDKTLNPYFFTRNIMKMAAQNLNEYAEIVKTKNIIRFLNIADEDPDNAFNEGLIDELLRLKPVKNVPMIILVDAFDEAYSRKGKTNIVNFLSNKINRLPEWIKIIVTTRPNPDILLKFNSSAIIDLNKSIENRNHDIITFIQNELPELAANIELVEKTALRCDGNMLFTRLLIDDIKLHNFELNIDTLNTLPKTVFEFYGRFMERDFPTIEEFETVSTLLKIFISSYEPLTIEQLTAITGESKQNIGSKIRKMSSFVENHDGKYSLYHQSFSDWLLSEELIMSPWAISLDEAHEVMISAFNNVKTDKKSPLYKYALNYLPNHCMDGKQYQTAIDLSRDNAYIYCQREKASFIQNTFKTAYQAACKIDDGIAMAEILIKSEKVSEDICCEKPLQLVRDGKWHESRELLKFYSKQEQAIWRILLAWEAESSGNISEMDSFYNELRYDGIPEITSISHAVILAILEIRKDKLPDDIINRFKEILKNTDKIPGIDSDFYQYTYFIDDFKKNNPEFAEFLLQFYDISQNGSNFEFKLFLLNSIEIIKSFNNRDYISYLIELLWSEQMYEDAKILISYIEDADNVDLETSHDYAEIRMMTFCGYYDKALELSNVLSSYGYQEDKDALSLMAVIINKQGNEKYAHEILSLALTTHIKPKIDINIYDNIFILKTCLLNLDNTLIESIVNDILKFIDNTGEYDCVFEELLDLLEIFHIHSGKIWYKRLLSAIIIKILPVETIWQTGIGMHEYVIYGIKAIKMALIASLFQDVNQLISVFEQQSENSKYEDGNEIINGVKIHEIIWKKIIRVYYAKFGYELTTEYFEKYTKYFEFKFKKYIDELNNNLEVEILENISASIIETVNTENSWKKFLYRDELNNWIPIFNQEHTQNRVVWYEVNCSYEDENFNLIKNDMIKLFKDDLIADGFNMLYNLLSANEGVKKTLETIDNLILNECNNLKEIGYFTDIESNYLKFPNTVILHSKSYVLSVTLVEIADILYNNNKINDALRCLKYATIIAQKIDIIKNDANASIYNNNLKIEAIYNVALYYQKVQRNNDVLNCYKLIEDSSIDVDVEDLVELSVRYAVLGYASDAIRITNKINKDIPFEISNGHPFNILIECLLDNGFYEESIEAFFHMDINNGMYLQEFAVKLYELDKINYIKKLGEYSLKYTNATNSMCIMLAAIYPNNTNAILEMLYNRYNFEPFND